MTNININKVVIHELRKDQHQPIKKSTPGSVLITAFAFQKRMKRGENQSLNTL